MSEYANREYWLSLAMSFFVLLVRNAEETGYQFDR